MSIQTIILVVVIANNVKAFCIKIMLCANMKGNNGYWCVYLQLYSGDFLFSAFLLILSTPVGSGDLPLAPYLAADPVNLELLLERYGKAVGFLA